MFFAAVVILFAGLVALSMPIVFALGLSGSLGLVLGNFSLQKLPSSLVAGSQSWVLLAIPTFVFAGNLMERCGMSYALMKLARVLVGWLRGGLGMSVVLAEYFFSGISGSTIADVSAIGAMLTPPMLRAGYTREHAASLVASATAMGIRHRAVGTTLVHAVRQLAPGARAVMVGRRVLDLGLGTGGASRRAPAVGFDAGGDVGLVRERRDVRVAVPREYTELRGEARARAGQEAARVLGLGAGTGG